MKIGSSIKPRDGSARNVDLFGQRYVFAPTKDKHGVTHFVAEVTNGDHAETLLQNGAFYAFDAAQAAPSKLTRDGKPGATTEPPKAWPSDVVDEAFALLDAPAADISAKTGNVSSLDVLRAALELEPGGKNRKTVLTTLETALKLAEEAASTA